MIKKTVTIEKPYLRLHTLLGEDRYRIDSFIDDNGIVVSYRGYDVFREKDVVIRELFPGAILSRGAGDDQKVSCRLMSDEALFLKMKEHMIARAKKYIGLYPLAGAANVLSFLEENKTVYVIEEYVDGAVTLGEFLWKRHSAKFTVEDLLGCLKPVFELLTKLHEKKLWHGGVSPSSIMVTPDPDRKAFLSHLCDPMEDAANERLGDIAVRALGFSPVEMFVEDAVRGASADIFGMGAVLYRYTTGEELPPYFERVNDNKEPSEPKTMKTVIMDFQSDALMKATALYEFDRYKTIEELYKALAPDDMDVSSLHSMQERAYNTKKLPFWYRRKQNADRRYVVIVAALIIFAVVLLVPRLAEVVRDERINRFYVRFGKASDYEKCIILTELSKEDRELYTNDFMDLPDDLPDEERQKLITTKYYDYQLGHYVTGDKVNTDRNRYEYLKIDYLRGEAWITYMCDGASEHKEFSLKPNMMGKYVVKVEKVSADGKKEMYTEHVGK